MNEIHSAGKTTACFLALLFCLFLLSPAPPDVCAKPLKVVVLTDAAGLGDKGFNDVCWKGVQAAQKDFGISAQFLQSREQADYVSNLTLTARNADVIITLGYLFVDAVKQVATQFPAVRFVHIEGEIPGDNVACFDFKSEEGGFMAGLVAGLFTKTQKVGMVSGMNIPPVEAYVAGFRAGTKTAEKLRGKPVETTVASAGSFNDPVKGKSLAKALIDKGADVIFRGGRKYRHRRHRSGEEHQGRLFYRRRPGPGCGIPRKGAREHSETEGTRPSTAL